MEKKEVKKLVVLFVAILLVGIFVDASRNDSITDTLLERQELGGASREESLKLSIEGLEDQLDYVVEVEAIRPTKEVAEVLFCAAIEEIEASFAALEGQEGLLALPLAKEYQRGAVRARWSVEPWEFVATDGTIYQEKIPESGQIVNLSVILSCGNYEKGYQFAYELAYVPKGKVQTLLEALDQWFAVEMEKEGQEVLYLPTELLGTRLQWTKERSQVTLSLLGLEILALVAIVLANKEKKRREEQKRQRQLEADYPEIVGQLTLLLGAGMNGRQSWNIIATQYLVNRQKRVVPEKIAYERMVIMNRRISEGENEKLAYQGFANVLQHTSYHRLIRLLIANLEKGATGITQSLEQEAKTAYEQKVFLAKKAGEEASTRMLMPLMLMMVLVMAIVMAPAVIDFMG